MRKKRLETPRRNVSQIFHISRIHLIASLSIMYFYCLLSAWFLAQRNAFHVIFPYIWFSVLYNWFPMSQTWWGFVRSFHNIRDSGRAVCFSWVTCLQSSSKWNKRLLDNWRPSIVFDDPISSCRECQAVILRYLFLDWCPFAFCTEAAELLWWGCLLRRAQLMKG